ncbi:aprataxin-like protein [Lignoscripta atroalba]|nr:aprataxin-like protein [Lignoscripta atroalba]
MANQPETNEDAITTEEMTSTSIPLPAQSTTDSTDSSPPRKPTNAFSELMSPKSKHAPPPPRQPPPTLQFTGRDGLGAYIASPASFPRSRVISHSPKFVVINDLYPKSSIHTLLLPRDGTKTLLHPLSALQHDATFLAEVQAEVQKLRVLVASELRRRYGKFSAQEKLRDQAMDADPPPAKEALPPGRDYSKDVISGIHASPSMSHLHIHVLSVDRMSEFLRHRRHYNSFNTPFLVDVDDFPLREGDERLRAGKMGYLDWELRCWRCGKGFGNRFKALKAHLEEEFEEWKME